MKCISLFLILLFSFSALATDKLVCRGFYYDVKSIEFGMLFRQVRSIDALEALNSMSKANLFTDGEPSPAILINHMIDTLLYYRALQELSHSHEIPEAFKNFDIPLFFSGTEMETKGRNKKFNFFKNYIKKGF